ncbi:MAG: hypothetical protein WCF67_22260, partial [Chitinophagaceae bacterium]
MNFLFLENDNLQLLVQAICRTLMHSVWIGCVAGIFAGLVLASVKTSAATRYNLLTALLGLFVLSTCFVFYLQLQAGVNENERNTNVAAGFGLETSSSLPHAISNAFVSIAAWCNE